MSLTTPTSREQDVRSRCTGITPLDARLEPWMVDLASDGDALRALLEAHGSPVNILDTSALHRNASELTDCAIERGVDPRVFFARKANKALAFVDAAIEHGHGIDVASERELRQVLDRGANPDDIIVTAAVKPRPLLELCVERGVLVAIDNADEVALLRAVIADRGIERVGVAVRLAPVFDDRREPTRFGLTREEAVRICGEDAALEVVGIHFHLDGYAAADRVAALSQAFSLYDDLRTRGHRPTFVDMGGGIPMSYIDDPAQWEAFWTEHRAGLVGDGPALTFGEHPLATVYPYHQSPTRADWLATVLTLAVVDGLTSRGLKLHCEPGRSILDGCGVTAARVEFRKQRADGTWLVGLAMNRTQCRSTSDDFLVDPILVPTGPARAAAEPDPIDAYLVGAYCIERELLTWRRLRFPSGVSVGDTLVFPNTAGYLMHILESASHQIPLARNVVRSSEGAASIDAIDV